jgi:hypothetical protein
MGLTNLALKRPVTQPSKYPATPAPASRAVNGRILGTFGGALHSRVEDWRGAP